jgi:hypothetical protein
VAAVVGAQGVFRLQPDQDAKPQPVVGGVFEQTLLDSADKSLLYGAVLADSLTNAVALQEKIEQLPTVAETQPPFYKDFLNPNPGEKLRLIGEIKAEVAPLKFSAPDLRPVDLPS